MIKKEISPLYGGLILGGAIFVLCLILYYLHTFKEPLIEKNILKNRLENFHHFINENQYDNNLLDFMIEIDSFKFYPAIKNGQTKVLFVESITDKGYSGEIKIITALDKLDQKPYPRVLGVAILEHKETPGLGDRIEAKKSAWILQFQQKNYGSDKNWQVKKQGGEFDALTGATISSKAVIDEIKRVLLNAYKFNKNNE